jgi:adenylate kinase
MNIVFLGPPGSGKGTQAKRLAPELNLKHLSTGDVFREAIAAQSELGREIKSYVDNGKLVPDELVSEVLFEKLRSEGSNAAVLLDGYPRTVDQAHALDGFSMKHAFPIDAVVFFNVDSAELVKRLSARRSCPKCNEVFNLVTRTPQKENVCDKCSGTLIQRPDDSEEVVRKRLDVYERQTAPVLDHYKAGKNFFTVQAQQPIEDVFRELSGKLASVRTA